MCFKFYVNIICKFVIIYLNFKLLFFKSIVNVILEKFKWFLKKNVNMRFKYLEILEYYISIII